MPQVGFAGTLTKPKNNWAWIHEMTKVLKHHTVAIPSWVFGSTFAHSSSVKGTV